MGTTSEPPPRQRPWLRDLVVGATLVVVTVALLWIERGRLGDRAAGPANAPRVAPPVQVAKTPVLRRRARPTRAGERRPQPAAPKDGVAAAAPPAPVDAAAKQAAEDAQRQELEQADRERRDAVNAEREILNRYALLLPTEEREVFTFLIEKFSWASDQGLHRPDDLEGVFLNRTFFAAGRWGAKAEFRRAWVYLLRALGSELPAETERAVTVASGEVFDRGFAFTVEVETAHLGAPLEGGDPKHWTGNLPSMEATQEVWDLRNEFCLSLFAEFEERLEHVLPQGDMDELRQFFALFNMAL